MWLEIVKRRRKRQKNCCTDQEFMSLFVFCLLSFVFVFVFCPLSFVLCLLSLSFVFELMRREAAAPCCTDQERVLITFHHKEGRGRITRSRHIHRNQASNHFHFPNQPNHFPSPCLTLAGIKDWASLEIVPPSIHTEIPQLPHYTWAAYQNCWNRSNSLHCSPM